MNILDILIPLYALIMLGFILKKIQFTNEDFWPGIEKVTYFILLPPLVFGALVKAKVDLSLVSNVFFVIFIPTVLSAGIQWLGFLSPKLSRATFSSMFQGSLRNNTIMSLAVAAWVVPDQGLAIMAVIMLIMIPTGNITAITILLRYGAIDNYGITDTSNGKWWKDIFKNPLIVACILGLTFNLLSIKLPQSLMETINFLGRSALPFALISVGASLKFGTILNNKLAILLSSTTKLIITPLLIWGLCILLGIDAAFAKVAIIYGAMPTAVSAYILAKQMGGDAEGMAQIITFQIVAAIFTLPIFLLISQQY